MRSTRLCALLLLLAAPFFACDGGVPEGEVGSFIEEDAAPVVPVPPATGPRDVAVLEIEGRGEIRIELLADVAPAAVARFVELAEADHYDGTTFHRVMPGFMIQGGDPNSRDRDPRNDGQGDGVTKVPDEKSDISQIEGIVSFAHRGRPGTADGQFFIMVGESRDIDGEYTVFGRVLEGQEIADAISRVERDRFQRWGPANRPLEDQTLADVRIERGAGGTAWRPAERAEGPGSGDRAAEPEAGATLSAKDEWSS